MLSDDNFVQLKKQKAELEIALLEGQVHHQEERSALEVALLRAQISELQSRESFFRALTSAVEREEGVSNLISFAQRGFLPEA